METIIDSALTLEEALAGKEMPLEVRESLVLLDIEYVSFDSRLHRGQLVVHKDAADDLREIFAALYSLSFPINKAVPLSAYDWDDERSMQDNNTSAFNYRLIAGTERLSNHSFGLALDVNPLLNPYEQFDGKIVPEGASYDPSRPGTLTKDSAAVQLFLERGWDWGGLWDHNIDWQHFARVPR